MSGTPDYKTTPATGLFLINPEKTGILVLDQQNVTGQFHRLGFSKLDPRWYLNMAHRITNLTEAMVIGDLAAFNVITGRKYLETSWLWDQYGYTIIHVPAKRIVINGNGSAGESPDTMGVDELGAKYGRKDMTDNVIRHTIQRSSSIPDVSHIILASHDVDFARDIKATSWGKSKKVTLLSVGTGFLAYPLRDTADDVVNVLGYAPAYSAYALNKRDWWRRTEDVATRRTKLQNWFQGPGEYPKYLEHQLRDMQLLFSFLMDKKQLIPSGIDPNARKLSLGRLKYAIHKFMSWEKGLAKTDTPQEVNPDTPIHSIEAQDLELNRAQAKACDDSLQKLLEIFIEHRVLLFEQEEGGSTRLYFLNTEHPAVISTMELSF